MSMVANDPARPPEIGEPAPDFELTDRAGARHRLSDLRGRPVLLAFQPPHWDPSWAESVRVYNRLIANLPGTAGARLLSIAGAGAWHAPLFDDGAVELPVVCLDSGPVAERYGAAGGGAVFVVDAEGRIGSRHLAGDPLLPPNAAATALEPADDLALESIEHDASSTREWTRRRFVATTLAAAVALAFARQVARAEDLASAASNARSPIAAGPVRLRVPIKWRAHPCHARCQHHQYDRFPVGHSCVN